VFAPYEKVDRPERGPGLGLGLHIAREIVRGHGGTIRVVPGAKGGTIAVVELPAGAPRPPEEGAAHPARAP
jgi:signal transduction histidine kinase